MKNHTQPLGGLTSLNMGPAGKTGPGQNTETGRENQNLEPAPSSVREGSPIKSGKEDGCFLREKRGGTRANRHAGQDISPK